MSSIDLHPRIPSHTDFNAVDAADVAPTTPPAAPAAPAPPAPPAPSPEPVRADADTVHGTRERALGVEQQARERLAAARPTAAPEAARPARGLARPTTPPADLERRVDDLERAGRTGAFAASPEAAARHARDVAAVLPHVDTDTRAVLQRPIDTFAHDAARSGRADSVEVARALAPAMSTRGVDAFASVIGSQPTAVARDGALGVLQAARTSTDPLVRRHAEGAILNDRPTVESALRGTHPSISRDDVVAMARDRPERVNQLVGVAEGLSPDIAADLRARGLERTRLPEVGGVLGGVIDGVEGLAAPFLHPRETAEGIARLGAAVVRDPIGTGRQIVDNAREALREDPSRAITGAVVGSLGGGVGHGRRAAAAGRALAVEAPSPSTAARTGRVDGPDGTTAVTGARAAATGLGDLRPHEVRGIQDVVNEAQRRMDRVLESVGEAPGALPVDVVVVGSAARGARRNADSTLPFGKGPGTRSDIDYAIPDPAVQEHVFTSRGASRPEELFWRQLPAFDDRTVGGMLHHAMPSVDEPRIWFRAGQDPVFLAPGQPNPSMPR